MRAVLLGGTGPVGRAVARRLLAAGWSVDLVGRDPTHVPADLRAARFHALDRAEAGRVMGDGADLLLDTTCFTAAHARDLLPLAAHATSTVMISSKAVYVDALGRHSNSVEAPCYDGPIAETQPTLPPGEPPYDSPGGYGPNKVAAEQVLLDSGLPVTVLRPSKIHGSGARPAREWIFVRRVLDGRRTVLLAHGGRGVDHPSAAVNIAALVETVAHRPGTRVLNAADPDAPSGRLIAAAVAAHLQHAWDEVPLPDDAPAGLGRHPWDAPHPVVLDTSAAEALGYRPVGTYADTVPDVIDWLVTQGGDDGSFEDAAWFDYAAEDAWLAEHPPRRRG